MYRCQLCGAQSEAGQPRQLIVIKESCRHPYRCDAFQKWVQNEKTKKWKWDWVDDTGGTGQRIVKEIPVCGPCKKAQEQACTG